ncbi:MAG: hypothetical protein HC772_10405 [Leptolyngbyaceae cyanobacterium CRU_2_3]|nr:hypothetical protein [Leptolyngbyaceae cyanobacterium CRU_2_3]
MGDIESLRQALEENYADLLESFNKVLDKYSLSDLEVTGLKLGVIDDQTEVKEASILREFNKILKEYELEKLYISSFTLVQRSGREGICQIKVNGPRITVECSR